MRKPSVFMLAMALLLLPAQALGSRLCLRNQFGHDIVFFLDLAASADGIVLFTGAWQFNALPCRVNPSAFVGSAWLAANGKAHFGLTIIGPTAASSATAGCSPYSVEGALDAASGFTTGSGFFQNLTVPADKGPLTFTLGAGPDCP